MARHFGGLIFPYFSFGPQKSQIFAEPIFLRKSAISAGIKKIPAQKSNELAETRRAYFFAKICDFCGNQKACPKIKRISRNSQSLFFLRKSAISAGIKKACPKIKFFAKICDFCGNQKNKLQR
jgi:hypothetical protein